MRFAGRLAPLAVVAAALAFLLSGPIRGATHDEEEYRNTVLATVLHARALAEGVTPYWTSELGFGMPHPLSPSLLQHPVMPLFAVLDPEVVVRLLYALHALLGAIGSWRLLRHVGSGRWAAALAAVTWTLATPSLNYVLTDFWIAEFVAWSLAPWLVFFALRVLDAPARQPWRDAVAFGLAAGLLIANGHTGHTPVFFVVLAVMFAADWRRTRNVWPALTLAVGVGLVVAAPILLQLATEVARFPDVKTRSTSETLIRGPELAGLLLRPFLAAPGAMLSTVLDRGARVPFFGGPMLLLAVAGVRADRRRRPLAAAFVAAFLLMLLPGSDSISVLSGTYLFRDPMVLFGVVLGGLAWQRLAAVRPLAASLIAGAQVAVLAVSAWPFVQQAYGSRPYWEASLHQSATTRALRAWVPRLPGRWYLAPELDAQVRNRALFDDGVWMDVGPYKGLPFANGIFKGVSADPIYPSEYLPYGRVNGQAATVLSNPTLDVMSVGAVLATVSEPVSPSLEEVARIAHARGELRLLRNPGAWPGAGLIDDATAGRTLGRLPGCDNDGVLCLDFAPVTSASPGLDLTVARRHGSIRVNLATAVPGDRWLLISEMYRPGWRARAANVALRVAPLFGGVIGVRLPAGVRDVELTYRPPARVAVTWLSYAGVLAAVLALVRRPRTKSAV